MTLGLYHLGVLKCLANARLLPRIISGASSGSIMASLICTKTVDEIPQMFDPSSVKLVKLGISELMSVSVHSFAIRRMFLNEMDPLIPHL
jgi:predicted acylesterase/phospholipase RssA